jgi:hypothetical protein
MRTYEFIECDMTLAVGEPDTTGRLRRACSRCGKQTNPTPHGPERIHFHCDAWPRWWEFGYWLWLVLSAIGVNKGGVSWIARKLNLVPPGGRCGCDARKEWLNTLGGKVRTRWDVFMAAIERLSRSLRLRHQQSSLLESSSSGQSPAPQESRIA